MSKLETLHAVEKRDVQLLKRTIEQGYPIHGSCSYRSAKRGDIDCLKVLHENGCYWNEKTCLYAAFNGSLECLKYAHENGCPWARSTLFFSIHGGHLACAKYYIDNAKNHDKNEPFCRNLCKLAALRGQLHCLAFLHENGYAWDKDTPTQAASSGRTECLKYAFEK